jgi:hypothetical protein
MEAADRLEKEGYRKSVSNLEASEREKIEATEKGSAARLEAIVAAIHEEENWGLQETGFYRSLLVSRVAVARQMTDEQNKLAAEAGKEQAETTLKMGELQIALERAQLQRRVSTQRESAAQLVADELKISAEENQSKMAAFAAEIAALDKHGKD